MKGFLITHKGMEDIAASEVRELIGKNSKIGEACVVFDINSYEDLFKLCYKSQSSIGIYYFLSEFNYDDIFNDFKKNIEKIKLNDWLSKNIKFRVKCTKNYDNKLSTPEIEEKLGGIIIDHIKKIYNYIQKVDLENHETTIFFYLTINKCYVGIDFAGFDLSKRCYKISIHPSDIRGTIGYFLVRLSNYNKNETLLDCFLGSGIIPIEAALFALNSSINFFNKEKFVFLKFGKFKNYDFNSLFRKFDKEILDCSLKIYGIDSSMKYLNSAKRNSKIAGIGKKINFSRIDIEWLDAKFDRGKVDKIIAKMPSLKRKDIGNIYNEFFYQAEFILNKRGNMVLIGDKELIGKFSSKYNFEISCQREVISGKMKYSVFMLAKQNKGVVGK